MSYALQMLDCWLKLRQETRPRTSVEMAIAVHQKMKVSGTYCRELLLSNKEIQLCKMTSRYGGNRLLEHTAHDPK